MRLFIHPIFFLVGIVAIFYSATYFFIALIFAVLLHELAHAMTARYFGTYASSVALTPFGGAVNIDCKFMTVRQKNIVLLAGPICSLIFALIFGVFVWLFPTVFGVLEYIVASNFLVGIMNVIPILPLDGGKILSSFIKPKYILIWSNITFGLVLFSSIIVFNFWLIAFSVVTIIQINWEFKRTVYKDKFSCRMHKKTGTFIKCAVLSSNTLFEVYKLVNKKKPTEFIITDMGNKIFYENDLENWLLTIPSNSNISSCLSK